MSSSSRTYPIKNLELTRFHKPDSPCYNDSTLDATVLFPFTYSNGVLDISYEGNTFEQVMVETTGVAPDSECDNAIQILSGPRLVTSLGENFKAYIRAWRTAIDENTPIEIYIHPQVIRVQEAQPSNITALSGNSYQVSTDPPASDTYPTGTVANNYETKYVFKTPLTFTTIEGGVKQYITFTTFFDQE